MQRIHVESIQIEYVHTRYAQWESVSLITQEREWVSLRERETQRECEKERERHTHRVASSMYARVVSDSDDDDAHQMHVCVVEDVMRVDVCRYRSLCQHRCDIARHRCVSMNQGHADPKPVKRRTQTGVCLCVWQWPNHTPRTKTGNRNENDCLTFLVCAITATTTREIVCWWNECASSRVNVCT